MNEFSLKPRMLLGVSYAATQVDGGALAHSWNDWHARGRIKDGSDPAVAADHWNRWREDVMLMHRMGIQTCRCSVEWARVEPEEGRFDDEALARIKEELMLMIGMGIRPLLTLHHFSDPMWFAAKGGWEKYDNVRFFLIFVEHVVQTVGHLVSEYITINEPNEYAFNGYVSGRWPPGKKSLTTAMTVMSNLAAAHIKAYRLIHDVRRSLGFKDTKVSFAARLVVFEAKNRLNPAQRMEAAEAERLYQKLLTEAMVTGEFRRPLKNNGRCRKGTYCDFYAVDYDSRAAVARLVRTVRKDNFKNDLGGEIYPQGIVRVCTGLMKLRPMPIYITANGVCDLGDSFRSRYIYEHLKALCESKLPVKRYYYRGFTDGFEWSEGNYARSGLVHTDFDTMARTVKRSGEFYAKIIEESGVTEELYEKYVAGECYHY